MKTEIKGCVRNPDTPSYLNDTLRAYSKNFQLKIFIERQNKSKTSLFEGFFIQNGPYPKFLL